MMKDIGQRLLSPTKAQTSCYLSIYLYIREIISLLSKCRNDKLEEQTIKTTMVF